MAKQTRMTYKSIADAHNISWRTVNSWFTRNKKKISNIYHANECFNYYKAKKIKKELKAQENNAK